MFFKVVIVAFVLIEVSNLIALYFFPGSKKANAVGVFTAWEQSKAYPEIHDFIRYLVYWVAGVKLIMLMLLGVILVYGTEIIQRITLAALGLATLSFFWRLFPLVRKLDKQGQIMPRNYSTYLGIMILVMVLLFAAGVIF